MRPPSCSDEETLRAAQPDDPESVPGPGFLLHPVEVIFDRLLRKEEVVGYLFIRKPLGDQWDDLLFAPREP